MFLRSIVAALTLCIVAQSATAQSTKPDARTLEAAREMLDASGALKSMTAAGTIGVDTQMDLLANRLKHLPPRAIEIMREEVDITLGIATKEFVPSVVEIFASELTYEEIRQITAFWRTPIGRKMASLQPDLMRRGADVMVGILKTEMPKMQARLKKRFDDEGVFKKRQ